MSSAAKPSPINWRIVLFTFVTVLSLSVPQAALMPLLDRDEPRFAEASREMLQSGNFVVPTFNGEPRYAKPPLIYWCQVASYLVFGQNAFAARLPSLLATAATAALLVTWGMRLGDTQVGLGAALSYAFCLQTIQQGRVATADALLIFFMTLTAFTGWMILRPRTPGLIRPICYLILAIGFAGGFLAKGPETLLPAIPLLWCARKSGFATIAKIVLSFFVGLALVLLWAIPAYIQTHGDYWRVGMSEGVGQRMVVGLQGHGSSSIGWYLLSVPLYYPLLFCVFGLPWAPLIFIQRKRLFTAWKPTLTDTYLIINAVLIFVIFSLMVTKLPHYTLPAFPFIALLFAKRLRDAGQSPGFLTDLGWVSAILFFLFATIVIPVAIANHATPSPVGELVRAAGKNLTPETEFALVDFQEPNTVWEMRSVVIAHATKISSSGFESYIAEPGPRAVIFSQSVLAENESFFTSLPAGTRFFTARGFNAAKGKFIDLYLVVKL